MSLANIAIKRVAAKHRTHFSTALHALSHRAVNDVAKVVACEILHCKGEIWAECEAGSYSGTF